jgi:hypothetical protein
MARNTPKQETSKPGGDKTQAAMAMMPELDYQSLALAGGTTMQALMRASDAMLKGVMALSQEMTEFTNARLRQNVERSETLLRCSDPAEAFGLQCDFAHKATQHYLDEANRLMALATTVTGKCWEPLEECTRETLGRFKNGAQNGGRAHAETPARAEPQHHGK